MERLEKGQTITVYAMVFNATFNTISVILWWFKPQQKNGFVWKKEKDNNKTPFYIKCFPPPLLKCISICILGYGKNITDLFFSVLIWYYYQVYLHVQKNTIICIG